jgi:hypothetical protein
MMFGGGSERSEYPVKAIVPEFSVVAIDERASGTLARLAAACVGFLHPQLVRSGPLLVAIVRRKLRCGERLVLPAGISVPANGVARFESLQAESGQACHQFLFPI